MFGTSGIRGLYGTEITEELAMKIANAFADNDMAIGRDIRKTGVSLSKAAHAGAMAAGRDTIDLGIVPTPMVALATKKYSCNGIMITASHNPEEYNGLKLISKTKEIDKQYEKEIVKRYNEDMKLCSWNETGKTTVDNRIIYEHKEMVKSLVDWKRIAQKRLKVLVDCNGAGIVITPPLLKELGCDVVVLNYSVGGFNRPSEPNEKNLQEAIRHMRTGKFDLCIAHDGDADRTVVIDDRGEILPLDVQLAIMIEHEMRKNKNKKIVSTVEASLAVREVVEQNNGEIIITPVGSTYVADMLEEKNALFGGEPCGEYIYKDGVHVPDAILAAAKFLEVYCENGKLSEQRKKYKQYFIAREKFKAKDKYETVGKVKESLDIDGKIRDDDGIRIDEEDGWMLVRASGTEPIVRLTMEYKTKEKLEKRKKEISEIIEKNI
ncbi:phosphoglucosamine mutase [Candidatus Micrarchaeota archaeon]|nr:phosphoglucosamine mutase [Candidatus Micrarchaeota archaeon]MBU1886100.1 phosphoglucosamine mutase [Candidatus Micrarchaeota archaeon]